jgi:tetratricopeptide (TPR) repeat protein
MTLGLFTTKNVKSGKEFSSGWRWIILIVPLVVAYLLLRVNFAKSNQLNSLENGFDGNWVSATEILEPSIDLDPKLKLYYEQIGYAFGVQTFSKENLYFENDLSHAINSYEIANEIHPMWAPNYVNLSELYDFDGRPEDSIKILESISDGWFRSWPFLNLFLAEKFESIGKTDEAKELIIATLEQNYWNRDYVICRINLLCQDISLEMIPDPISDYSLHKKIVSLINEGKLIQAKTILNGAQPLNSSVMTWIDRASTHLYLGEIPQAEYALTVAEKIGVKKHQYNASYFALIEADILIHQNNPEEAINALESIEKPLIKPRNYETWLYQSFGFPNHLLPSLSILEKTEYDLLIFRKLEELYTHENRFEDADWAKNQADLLSNILETN